MADTLTPEQRSANMSRIRGKNTKPELLVRRLLHAAGYRFRLHGAAAGAKLPGKPDLVFPGRKKVVFVNGCFWHTHTCRAGTRSPSTNAEFWAEKRHRTVQRDAAAVAKLKAAGWDTLVVWECEIKDVGPLEKQLRDFLGPPGTGSTARLEKTHASTHPGGTE